MTLCIVLEVRITNYLYMKDYCYVLGIEIVSVHTFKTPVVLPVRYSYNVSYICLIFIQISCVLGYLTNFTSQQCTTQLIVSTNEILSYKSNFWRQRFEKLILLLSSWLILFYLITSFSIFISLLPFVSEYAPWKPTDLHIFE